MTPPTQDDAPVRRGDILAGKYRVERVLGVGGMGVVVAAMHVELQRLVALKFVRPNKVKDRETMERFVREARAAVRLKSEHVARVLDVGKLDDGAPYMVMEFLEGSDLDNLLRDGPLGIELAADCIVQACEALAEAHAIGLVHRDLKPHNIFVTHGVGGDSVVKVLDFGISKMLHPTLGATRNLTRTTAVLGSPFYMSPEQMRSARRVDARSDIWSLGVILYELLSTHVPWEAESITELAVMVAQEPPTPIEQYRPEVPEGMRCVIERCLEKDPALRFPDAGELAMALAPFASARSRSIAERARNASRVGHDSGRMNVEGSPHSGSKTPPPSGASTHATWGTATPVQRRESMRAWIWAAVVVVAAAGVGLGVVSLRHTPASTAPTASGTTPTKAETPPSLPPKGDPAVPTTTPEPAVVAPVVQPVQTETAHAGHLDVPSKIPSKPTAKPAASPSATVSASATETPPKSSAATTSDDGIPLLR